ncbi:hypothetical protein [Jeotgalibaca porci]|uniref:hypothetical protein n=1 Tax=Jeotgalibaca porci TaxID=1868793 RepID=UPI00359FD242
MKKRTRRVLALIILVSITSGLEPLQKLLFAGPCLVALLIELDEFNLKYLERGSYYNG